jgi:hypothetical protein
VSREAQKTSYSNGPVHPKVFVYRIAEFVSGVFGLEMKCKRTKHFQLGICCARDSLMATNFVTERSRHNSHKSVLAGNCDLNLCHIS